MHMTCPYCLEETIRLMYLEEDVPNGAGSIRFKGFYVGCIGGEGCPDITGTFDTTTEAFCSAIDEGVELSPESLKMLYTFGTQSLQGNANHINAIHQLLGVNESEAIASQKTLNEVKTILGVDDNGDVSKALLQLLDEYDRYKNRMAVIEKVIAGTQSSK